MVTYRLLRGGPSITRLFVTEHRYTGETASEGWFKSALIPFGWLFVASYDYVCPSCVTMTPFHIDSELMAVEDSEEYSVFDSAIEVIYKNRLFAIISVKGEGLVTVNCKDLGMVFVSFAGFSRASVTYVDLHIYFAKVP